LLGALVLAACGGHTASRSDVIARANAICATATNALRAVPSPSGASTTALGRYFKRAAPIVATEAAGLRALPRPAARRATLDGFIAAQSAAAADYRRLAAAATAGHAAAVQQALSRLQTGDAGGLARRYGLSQCAGSTATVR
jgi:hypothetical protein